MYTKLSDGAQKVFDQVSGPANVIVVKKRSQSFTHDTGFDFSTVSNFDAFGSSIYDSFVKEKTDLTPQSAGIAANASSAIVFTPILKCSKGMSLSLPEIVLLRSGCSREKMLTVIIIMHRLH